MLYIYVFDDGEIKWSVSEPTEGDKQSVAAGTLSIVRIDEVTNVPKEWHDGRWVFVDSTITSHEETGDYHV